MPRPTRFNPSTAVQVYCTGEGRADWLRVRPGQEFKLDPDTAHCLVVECGLGLFAFSKDDPSPDKRYTRPQAACGKGRASAAPRSRY